VSVATVERASKLVKKGAPEVVKAAQKGEIRLGGLSKFLSKSVPEQQKLIAEKGSIKDAIKAANAEPSTSRKPKTEEQQELEKAHNRYHTKQEELMDVLRQFTSIEHAEEYAGKTKKRLDETLQSMRDGK
jgi:hypothetical protein